MYSISLLLIVALTAPTALADPDATPSAHARTTSHDSRESLYSYAYAVDVPEYSNFYDHEEDRSGDVTRGRFRVALPDNRLQTVVYRAGNKGYSAQVSYDQHPDFHTLRASVEPVGPIREGPEIGESVISGPRRGENWKDRKHHSHEITNNVEPTFQHQRRPRPSPTSRPRLSPTSRPRPSPTSRPRPSPTARPRPSPTSRPRLSPTSRPLPTPFHPTSAPVVRRRPTPTAFKPRPTASKRPQRFRPSPQQAPTTAAPPPPRRAGPIAQRLTSNPISHISQVTTTPAPTRPRPAQRLPEQASLFVSTEGLEDPEILNRLIEAIRIKVEEEEAMNPSHHGDEDDDHKKKKPRYSISDKASVLDKLRAVVHSIPLAKL